jgi:hypothetical protein
MKRVNNERPEDFLMKYGKAVRERHEEMRVENMRKETRGLTFKPTVCKTSEKIDQQKERRTRSGSN